MADDGRTHNVVFNITRKSLEATVVRACPNCEAPGVYKSDERTLQLWPGCYAENATGQRQVGTVCPNCGKPRRRNVDLGELSASMPKWIWACILATKWIVIVSKSFLSTRT